MRKSSLLFLLPLAACGGATFSSLGTDLYGKDAALSREREASSVETPEGRMDSGPEDALPALSEPREADHAVEADLPPEASTIRAPCAAPYDKDLCPAYLPGTSVSLDGHNWLCVEPACANCAGYASCAPADHGCPWNDGHPWKDDGECAL